MDEHLLIERAKEGDIASFEALIRKYQNKIYSLAFRIAGNADDAFDISQEAIIKIYGNIKRFYGRSAFSTWVYTVTKNAGLDFLRKRKRIFSSEEELTDCSYLEVSYPAYGSPEESFEKKESKNFLISLIRSLPEAQKTVLILRDIEGYSYEEIAKILKISEGTVKSRLFRARESLRTLYIKNGRRL